MFRRRRAADGCRFTMAIASEANVIEMEYLSGVPTEKASMPMKCIDQTPVPIATAPPSSQLRPTVPRDSATRAASLSTVYETTIATTMERVTSQGL